MKFATFLLLAVALTIPLRAATTTFTFDTADAPGDGEGWWNQNHASDPGNYIFLTGFAADFNAPYPNPVAEYRSHLSFSVTGIDAPIQAAVLRLSEWGSFSNGNQFSGTVTLGLFDVSTDPYDLNSANTARPDIFRIWAPASPTAPPSLPPAINFPILAYLKSL